MRRVVSRQAERVGTVLGAMSLLGLGLIHGVQQEVYVLDLFLVTVRIVVLEAVMSVVGFTLFAAVTGGLLVRETWSPREPGREARTGPPLTAIVPVYRDHAVLHASVESLLESEYEDLEIVIVGEPGDEATRDRAERFAAAYEHVSYEVNRYPGSKAGAINHAVETSDADHFAVFDVDERVSHDFLPAAMGALLDGADVFQGRRIPRPHGALETLAYCERIVFHASYKAVELIGFVNCRSSSTAFTRAAVERVGGYDDMLTEDLAFSHACYRSGLRVVSARNRTNTMEAPHSLRDLWGQRKRWRVGQIEVLHATVSDLLRGDRSLRTLISIGRMASSLFGSLVLLLLVAKFLLLLVLDIESAVLVPFGVVLATILAIAVRDRLDGRIAYLHPALVCMPLIYPAFGVLTLKSLLEYVGSWSGEWYRVTKTGA